MVLAGAAPDFWWRKADWRSAALRPLAAVYGAVAVHRMRHAPRVPVEVPVLCVGNFTVGGEGKTPVAIALARKAREMGLNPGFLSRGHGGAHGGLHRVDASGDDAAMVGDEPLLLARAAPTVVARDRVDGARRLIGEGCDLIIMDDGFQSAHLAMDFALMVMDARRGLGNGLVLPAGPLRAPLDEQMRHADALLCMGEGDGAQDVPNRFERAGKAVFRAAVQPVNVDDFRGRRVLAFAGIGNPSKFFDSLRSAGAEVAVARPFPDHHPYTHAELQALLAEAEAQGLALVTTEKDLVRISTGTGTGAALREKILCLRIEAVFSGQDDAARIIEQTISRGRERIGRSGRD